jgi:poly-gamma-glutamate capsule biosynthesis protein CapA/YwtB (metallophosphatase superfamily)
VLALGVAIGAGIQTALDELGSGDGEVATGEADGTARLEPTPGPIRIVITGEVAAGSALGGALDAGALGGIAGELGDADLALLGLSGTVLDDAPDVPDVAWIPGTTLDLLAAVGVDVVSVASERALDLGPEGLDQTLASVASRLVLVAGMGADEDAAYAPVQRVVGGQTVAVIAASQTLLPERIASDTAGPDRPGVASAKRVDRLVAEVRAASDVADVVVVLVRWGDEGETCPSASQQELAVALVDAGADVVAGSGAGRVQGSGRLGDAVVAYGLGALVADGTDEVGVLAVEVQDGEVRGWSWVPGQVVDGAAEPVAMDDEIAAELAERRACAGLGP